MKYRITKEGDGFAVSVIDPDGNLLTKAGAENLGLAHALVTKARTEGWNAIGNSPAKPKAAPRKKG